MTLVLPHTDAEGALIATERLRAKLAEEHAQLGIARDRHRGLLIVGLWVSPDRLVQVRRNRLTSMDEGALTTTAQRRQTDPPKLVHLVQGDLDWIVMKCLEKDRGRRYETANGLVFDLRRHLNNEPVFARPTSNRYRLRKWARRNRLLFVAGSAIFGKPDYKAVIAAMRAELEARR